MSPTNASVTVSFDKVSVKLSDVATHEDVLSFRLLSSFDELEVQAIDMAARVKSVTSSFML